MPVSLSELWQGGVVALGTLATGFGVWLTYRINRRKVTVELQRLAYDAATEFRDDLIARLAAVEAQAEDLRKKWMECETSHAQTKAQLAALEVKLAQHEARAVDDAK